MVVAAVFLHAGTITDRFWQTGRWHVLLSNPVANAQAGLRVASPQPGLWSFPPCPETLESG